MKKNVLSRVLSLFLALILALGTVPATVISAYAEGAPEMLVTSLTELYSGDETRAREDLEALSAAGLLGADGTLVALDIRDNGESVERSALAERIAKGEAVGEITVNGNAATAEQIVQIQSVQAAIEIAELLDEEIDVTDEHVANLEELLTGIQNGNVDLENALETGALSLQSANSPAMMAGTEGELPTLEGVGTAAGKLTVSEDGKSYIGPYLNGGVYETEHAFTFLNQEDENKGYYYTDNNISSTSSVVSPNAVTATVTVDDIVDPVDCEYTLGVYYQECNPTFTIKLNVPEGTTAEEVGTIRFNSQLFSSFTFATWQWVNSNNKRFSNISYFSSPVMPKSFSGDKITDGSTVETSYWAIEEYLHPYKTWVGQRGVLLCLKDLEGNASFANGANAVYAKAYFEVPGQTMDNIYLNTNQEAGSTTPIYEISVPRGTYYSGEYVPITVNFGADKYDRVYVKADENTKLVVNGTECELLDKPGIYGSLLTFLYKVKDVDAVDITVESLTGLKNRNDEPVSLVDSDSVKLTDGKINKTFGANEGVVIASGNLHNGIDWDNVKCGVDESGGAPAVTIVLPLKNVDDNLKQSLAKASREFVGDDGQGIELTLPDYGTTRVKNYVTSMYFGSKSKKYPVYVVTQGEDETPVALVAHFAADPNFKSYVRLDTLNLYMNRGGVADSSIPALSEAETDALGYHYFNGPTAPVMAGKVFQYFVAPAAVLTTDKYIERNQGEYEVVGSNNNFIKLKNPENPDFPYVYLNNDASHPERQHDVELLLTEDFYRVFANGNTRILYNEPDADLRLSYQVSNRLPFTYGEYFKWNKATSTSNTN